MCAAISTPKFSGEQDRSPCGSGSGAKSSGRKRCRIARMRETDSVGTTCTVSTDPTLAIESGHTKDATVLWETIACARVLWPIKRFHWGGDDVIWRHHVSARVRQSASTSLGMNGVPDQYSPIMKGTSTGKERTNHFCAGVVSAGTSLAAIRTANRILLSGKGKLKGGSVSLPRRGCRGQPGPPWASSAGPPSRAAAGTA